MKRINSRQKDFEVLLGALVDRGQVDFSGVEDDVRKIIGEVRERGDAALVEMAAAYDNAVLSEETLKVDVKEMESAYQKVDNDTVELISEAGGRIRAFHQNQKRRSWFVSDEHGDLLGQNISPVESAGLYVPGGKAVYPSTVLMNAIPAQVAGVEKIIICTPAPGGSVHPLVLVTADLLGIREVYKAGGAQAIAAMAYGTRTIPRVDKIVGPGNIYVAAAKRAVYGKVSIDMIAGPSEVFIIADEGADPSYIAADLLSQAEHDEMASCVLITTSEDLAGKVERELETQLAELKRKSIAGKALDERGYVIIVDGIDEAFDIANNLGPEHLEVLVENPLEWILRARFAGSAFFGPYTPEPIGDYMAGPNHVLPTGGAARFSSPLGVDDFMVRSNIIHLNPDGFDNLAGRVARFADLEGLEAHARSVRIRKK